MTVCTWEKAKRVEVVERWLDAGGICRRFNNRIDGAVNWPDDVIEEFLENILGILDPLVDRGRTIPNTGHQRHLIADDGLNCGAFV